MKEHSPNNAKSSNSRVRFRLASLLLAMAMVCLVLGLLNMEIMDAKRSKRVYQQYRIPHIDFEPRENEYVLADLHLMRPLAEWLADPFLSRRVTSMHVSSLVGEEDLEKLVESLPCETLHLYRPELSDEAMKLFADMPNLKELWLHGLDASADGLAALGSCQQLETLMIREPGINDATVSKIGQLGSVRKLEVVGWSITEKGFQEIAKMPALRHLFISLTSIEPEHIDAIAEMDQLEVLETYSPGWTDASLARLQSLPSLESFTMRAGDVTSSGLRDLAAVPQLKFLHFQNMPNFNDEYLMQLSGSRNLRKIILKDCGVTEQGKQKFLSAAPGCSVQIRKSK